MKKLMFIAMAAVLMIASSCSTVKKTDASFYAAESVVYLNNEADGSITVRATGSGRNRYDAIDQAKKNALREMMFKGINVPGNAYISKPLITTVNAEEKYADFLNAFFVDGGAYEQFVSSADKKILSNRKNRNKIQAKVTTTVRLLRPELAQYLKENEIIK